MRCLMIETHSHHQALETSKIPLCTSTNALYLRLLTASKSSSRIMCFEINTVTFPCRDSSVQTSDRSFDGPATAGIRSVGGTRSWYCGNCGKGPNSVRYDDYCPYCGRARDSSCSYEVHAVGVFDVIPSRRPLTSDAGSSFVIDGF